MKDEELVGGVLTDAHIRQVVQMIRYANAKPVEFVDITHRSTGPLLLPAPKSYPQRAANDALDNATCGE